MACEAVNKKLAAHIGKYDGLFARLCLIWHCIEHADRNLIDQIDEDTARRVEELSPNLGDGRGQAAVV